ncbi:MAG: HDOD domain-containing protein [Epsilonproteobacteria bacterium]|nr:HDOD domain-containing protein [Campylobacterota bacterium]
MSDEMNYTPIMVQIDALPPLPESVMKLEELFTLGDPAPEKVVEVIETDPALTVNILSQANSAYYSFQREIVSIQQAYMLLGAARIRTMALDFARNRVFDIDLSPYGLSTAAFAELCRLQSNLAFHWIMGVDMRRAKHLIPLAFLMETGKILIAREVINQGRVEEFQKDLKEFASVGEVETLYTSMSTAQVNALVFKRWQLGETFTHCMQYLESDEQPPQELLFDVQALRIIRSAINVREILTEHACEKALQLARKASLDPQKLESSLDRVRKKRAEMESGA